jgi:hypothetical protein
MLGVKKRTTHQGETQMKVQIKTAYGFEGPAIQYTGDDGYPAAAILPIVVAETADGRLFQLHRTASLLSMTTKVISIPRCASIWGRQGRLLMRLLLADLSTRRIGSMLTSQKL